MISFLLTRGRYVQVMFRFSMNSLRKDHDANDQLTVVRDEIVGEGGERRLVSREEEYGSSRYQIE